MAKVDLSQAKSVEEVAAIWSVFLLKELMERRERQEAAIPSCIFTFELAGNTPCLPVFPTKILTTPPDKLDAISGVSLDSFAYLAIVPGIPIPKADWDGDSPALTIQEQEQIPIGVPTELLQFDRSYVWWLTAVFVSKQVQTTYCAGFTGTQFSELKHVAGTHGGFLSSLGAWAYEEA